LHIQTWHVAFGLEEHENIDGIFPEKSSMNILKNISLFVPQRKGSILGLGQAHFYN